MKVDTSTVINMIEALKRTDQHFVEFVGTIKGMPILKDNDVPPGTCYLMNIGYIISKGPKSKSLYAVMINPKDEIDQ